MTDNVVVFPRSKRDTPPQSIEEIVEKRQEIQKEHIEFVIDEALAACFSFCYNEGFDVSSNECTKATGLFVEALRATLFKSVGFQHPLHELADSLFVQGEVQVTDQ